MGVLRQNETGYRIRTEGLSKNDCGTPRRVPSNGLTGAEWSETKWFGFSKYAAAGLEYGEGDWLPDESTPF